MLSVFSGSFSVGADPFADQRIHTNRTRHIGFHVSVTHYRDGGGLFQQNDTSHNVVLTGDQLVVNDDASGLSIPSFSVLTINHFDAYYEVYLNGILEYSSAVVSASTTTTGTMFFLKIWWGVSCLLVHYGILP